jgi:hypothetical protein
MERAAIHLHHSKSTHVEIWCDEEAWPDIQKFFYLENSPEEISKEGRMRQNRLKHVFEVVVRKATHKDILEKECIDQNHCVWVLKMFHASASSKQAEIAWSWQS